MAKEKLPAIHIYIGDWLKDEISGCSMAAQGLWLRMLFIMHESEKYGHFQSAGKPIADDVAARRCGCDDKFAFVLLLQELEKAGVVRRNEEGIIYSERMKKDVELREIRRVSGSKGGRPSDGKHHKKQKHNQIKSKSKAKTKQNTENDNDNENVNEDEVKKWFEDVWSGYPKKLGKEDALEKFREQVKTLQDLGNIKKALVNYCLEIEYNETDSQFIKHGSTWFNGKWKDYIDYVPRNPEGGKQNALSGTHRRTPQPSAESNDYQPIKHPII